MADNEYDKDQRYILKTLEELKGNVNELFKNDKAIEVSITSITSKLVIVGSIGSSAVGIIVAFVMNTMLGK